MADDDLRHRGRERHVEVGDRQVVQDRVVERVHLDQLDGPAARPATDALGVALGGGDEAGRQVEPDHATEREPAGERQDLTLATAEVDERLVTPHVPAAHDPVELDEVEPVRGLIEAPGIRAELEALMRHHARRLDAEVSIERAVATVLQQCADARSAEGGRVSAHGCLRSQRHARVAGHRAARPSDATASADQGSSRCHLVTGPTLRA
ncbi:MAG: hypothetical protein R3C32_13905 [Chloroflexota bacterium]